MAAKRDYKRLFDLTGRKAIVTGGSRGIGRAVSEALAAQGADVAVVVRSSIGLAEELAATFNAEAATAGADAGESFAIRADVSEPGDVARLAAEVERRWGRADILVNNAGIIHPGPADDFPLDLWRDTMSVNVEGVLLMSQAIGKMMIRQKSGSIVNIGSMSGRIVNWPFRHAAYNVSKAAVHMLTKCLATEWAEHGVRVNALAPGYILTELTEEVLRENPDVVRNHWAKGAVMDRIGTVDELAGAVVYLASDASSFTTGEIHTVDGGLTLR